MSGQPVEQRFDRLDAQVFAIRLVDHHDRRSAARTEALDRRKREAAVGSRLSRADAELFRQLIEHPFGASHRARNVVTNLKVPASNGLPPKLRIEREHFLDL